VVATPQLLVARPAPVTAFVPAEPRAAAVACCRRLDQAGYDDTATRAPALCCLEHLLWTGVLNGTDAGVAEA
jgi:hypothetical protein